MNRKRSISTVIAMAALLIGSAIAFAHNGIALTGVSAQDKRMAVLAIACSMLAMYCMAVRNTNTEPY